MLSLYDVFYDDANNCFQIRTKSEVVVIEFQDDTKKNIFVELDQTLNKNSKVKFNDLFRSFKKKFPEPDILEVFTKLQAANLLSPSFSAALNDLEKKDSAEAPARSNGLSFAKSGSNGQLKFSIDPNTVKLGIIKTGPLGDKIERLASKETYKKVAAIEVKSFVSSSCLEEFIQKHDLIVFESDHWNPYFLELVNKVALAADKPWILVRGLEGQEGSIGPIFWGRRTGCYNCLTQRLKSNMTLVNYFEEYENYLRKEKKSSKIDSAPEYFMDLMASMVMLELSKFIYQWDVPEVYGSMINVDFAINITKHALLKSPLCDVCKPKADYSLSPWLEAITIN